MITIYGSIMSPYVRKVLMALEFKKISYKTQDLKPNIPEDKKQLIKIHPLGKIPVLKDDQTILPDSSVICAYLEKKYLDRPLYPTDPGSYAKCIWYEEYADSCFINTSRLIFRHSPIISALLQHKRDINIYKQALYKNLPLCFDYLNNELKNRYLVDDRLTIADISIFSAFLNLEFIGLNINKARWGNLVQYLGNLSTEPCINIISQRTIKVLNEQYGIINKENMIDVTLLN
ncbi:MAG: glutathione S-transferase family protein [Candidatus Rickettsiella isopodorum]